MNFELFLWELLCVCCIYSCIKYQKKISGHYWQIDNISNFRIKYFRLIAYFSADRRFAIRGDNNWLFNWSVTKQFVNFYSFQNRLRSKPVRLFVSVSNESCLQPNKLFFFYYYDNSFITAYLLIVIIFISWIYNRHSKLYLIHLHVPTKFLAAVAEEQAMIYHLICQNSMLSSGFVSNTNYANPFIF